MALASADVLALVVPGADPKGAPELVARAKELVAGVFGDRSAPCVAVWYPIDGRTAEELLAAALDRLRALRNLQEPR